MSFADASKAVEEQAQQLVLVGRKTEASGLLDSLGRVLAEPVCAERDQPPFPRSTRDGFACRAANVGSPLTVVGLIRAGESWAGTVLPGQTVEIMTGAPVPAGADCVVMIEHVVRELDTVRLIEGRSIAPGENIVPTGAEATTGSVILPRGLRLAPAHIGAAAACGAAHLAVFARPRVAIVATGDELVEVAEQPLTYQIRNSNSYSLAAQVAAAGGEPVRLPIARDERAHLESIIRTGLEADLLLLSGGVSMGKYDLVEEVLLWFGAEFFFTGARIQPGKPVVFGKIALPERTVYFFGLPGNPVSTMVTFLLFVEPWLAALCGETFRGPRFAQARLLSDIPAKPGLTRFLPAVLSKGSLDPTVKLLVWQGSGDLAATSRSNCFLVAPAARDDLRAGEPVTVLLA